MTVLLVLFTFGFFLTVDAVKPRVQHWLRDREYRSAHRGTMITTPGFEALGALAQDGPSPEKK